MEQLGVAENAAGQGQPGDARDVLYLLDQPAELLRTRSQLDGVGGKQLGRVYQQRGTHPTTVFIGRDRRLSSRRGGGPHVLPGGEIAERLRAGVLQRVQWGASLPPATAMCRVIRHL
jgi:hypothetical protein